MDFMYGHNCRVGTVGLKKGNLMATSDHFLVHIKEQINPWCGLSQWGVDAIDSRSELDCKCGVL